MLESRGILATKTARDKRDSRVCSIFVHTIHYPV